MKDLKVSITGASGFIGQRLMLALNQQNHSITVLSRKEDRGFPVGVRVIKGDLRSNDCALDQFLNGCDVLFHCAGEVREPKIMREVHVGGTQRLIQALNKKANIKYIEMPESIRNQYQYHTCAEIDKIRSAGYVKSITSLEDGVSDYVKNYLTPDKHL